MKQFKTGRVKICQTERLIIISPKIRFNIFVFGLTDRRLSIQNNKDVNEIECPDGYRQMFIICTYRRMGNKYIRSYNDNLSRYCDYVYESSHQRCVKEEEEYYGCYGLIKNL